MKLLIVDDQMATLRGLSNGVDWQAEGFDIVETAQNAMEARASFLRGTPDLLLCDIEMPVESGLELCRWARNLGYRFRVIFLTCHSEFEYAKEAIGLQASDYIVQPAPYSEIRSKVHEVMKLVKEAEQNGILQKLGETYGEKQNMISSSLWRGFLMGAISYQSLPALPELPSKELPAYLLLLQVVHWTEADAQWEEELLTTALRSFVEDVFGPVCRCSIVAYMEHNTYAIMLQPKDEHALTEEDLRNRMAYLSDAYDFYMPCQVAIYPSEYCPISAMPGIWKSLVNRRNENVTDEKGVHMAEQHQDKGTSYTSRFRYWSSLLNGQSLREVERDACDYLDQLSAGKTINARILSEFYFDFYSFLAQLKNKKLAITEFLGTQEGQQLSQDALHSVSNMKRLVHYVADRAEAAVEEEKEQTVTQRIISYIHENILNDVQKEDIAGVIHMNMDYATRVFKKETGMTIKGYIVREKLLAAREMLRTTSLSVSNVAVQLGYENFSYFSYAYKKEFGISPSDERRSTAMK